MSKILTQEWYGFFINSKPKRIIIGPAESEKRFRAIMKPLKKNGTIRRLSYGDIYDLFNVSPPPTIKAGESAKGPLTFIRENTIVSLLPCA